MVPQFSPFAKQRLDWDIDVHISVDILAMCYYHVTQTSLRMTLHSVVAWVSRNSLLKTGAIYEVYVTAMVECVLHFSWLWVPIPLQSLCWYTLLDLNLLPNFFLTRVTTQTVLFWEFYLYLMDSLSPIHLTSLHGSFHNSH